MECLWRKCEVNHIVFTVDKHLWDGWGEKEVGWFSKKIAQVLLNQNFLMVDKLCIFVYQVIFYNEKTFPYFNKLIFFFQTDLLWVQMLASRLNAQMLLTTRHCSQLWMALCSDCRTVSKTDVNKVHLYIHRDRTLLVTAFYLNVTLLVLYFCNYH